MHLPKHRFSGGSSGGRRVKPFMWDSLHDIYADMPSHGGVTDLSSGQIQNARTVNKVSHRALWRCPLCGWTWARSSNRNDFSSAKDTHLRKTHHLEGQQLTPFRLPQFLVSTVVDDGSTLTSWRCHVPGFHHATTTNLRHIKARRAISRHGKEHHPNTAQYKFVTAIVNGRPTIVPRRGSAKKLSASANAKALNEKKHQQNSSVVMCKLSRT